MIFYKNEKFDYILLVSSGDVYLNDHLIEIAYIIS
jgi:hypothetical protein